MTKPDTGPERAGRRPTVAGRILRAVLGPPTAWYFSLPAAVVLLALGVVAVAGFTRYVSDTLETNALQEAKRDADWEGAMIASTITPGQIAAPARGDAYARLGSTIRAHVMHSEVLGVKLWSPGGQIIYSDDESLVGTTGPVAGELAAAFSGQTSAQVEEMDENLHASEQSLGRALETFVPIRPGDSGDVAAVLEVYRDYGPLAARIDQNRQATYIAAAFGFALILAVLLVINRWGVSIIGRRTDQLLARERELLAENEERKRAEASLLESRQVLEDINAGVTDGILVVSRDLEILWANEAAARRYGGASVIGKTCYEVSHLRQTPCQAPHDPCPIRQLLETGRPATVTHVHPRVDGDPSPVEVTAYPIRDENGEITKFVHVARDVTERVRAEAAVRESEAKFRTLTDTVAAATFIFQGESILYANRTAEIMTGYSRDELLAQNFWEVIHPQFREMVRARGLARQRGEPVPPRYEVKILTKGGEERWVDFQAGSIEFNGGPAALGTAFDITDRKRAEDKIAHMAYHDELTGLPNRALLIDRIETALAQARRSKQPVAVLLLDVDGFKLVNDTLGHAAGDQFLQCVADRLRDTVREGDTIGRVGGDEFVVLLPSTAGADEALAVATRIVEAFRRPWSVAGREFNLTASVGISLYPGDGDDADTLLRSADTAMYRAKDEGRDNLQVFAPAMSAYLSERVSLQSDLRHGLDHGELLLHYQPQVRTGTGEIIGAEALLRWHHPERGLVYPNEFIPLAEATGLIVPIGEWVLRTACAENKAWQASGLAPVRVAVNLSVRQFQQAGLSEMVAAVLGETGLDPDYLELEITENAAMRDVDSAIRVLKELRAIGVHVSIDDFGTGYSSLAYLKRLPIDGVKIDQSFVRDITTDQDDAAIVTATIGLAATLQLRAIAEGVETGEQLEFLKVQRCPEVQGYLFGRPAPAAELRRLLAAQAPATRDAGPALTRTR